MDPIAVDVRLIKAVLGTELRLTPGRALMARVVATDAAGRGALSIAGTVVDAKLPRHVQAGAELRLIVREVSSEKIVLSLSDQAAAAPPPPAVPLPGGGRLRVTEQQPERAGGQARDAHVLAVRYDAPALGPVDLRFELDQGSLRLSVTLGAGDPVSLAQAGADQLQQALRDSVGRAVSVTVSARREPIDVYA